MQNRIFLVLFFLICVGIFFRIGNLNWGSPFYFHPDERNIAALVASNPHANTFFSGTFAYGNFLILLSIFLKIITSPIFIFFGTTDSFSQATIILRLISFVSSLGVLYFLYLCGKVWSTKVALISLLFGTFSVGLIQQSHFGTFDMFITCCMIASYYFVLRFSQKHQNSWYFFSIVALILGSAAKITAAFLFILPLAILFFSKKKIAIKVMLGISGFLLLCGLTPLLSPYYLTHEFLAAIFYEKGIVDGSLSVFYTQSFAHTIPFLFQFLHIYPFLLNPFVELIFIPCFFYLLFIGITKKNLLIILLLLYFLLLFIPQAFLFAKWTRYILPTIPFVYLIIAIAAAHIHNVNKKMQLIVISLLIGISGAFSFFYFQTAFYQNDTRISAATYAMQHVKQTDQILTESYDIGILPFNNVLKNIQTFDFYTLDQNPLLVQRLAQQLTKTDVILLPSQRLLRSRLLDKKSFPIGNAFYSHLLDGSLGFTKIYQTPCDFFCSTIYLNNPIFAYEETASVFERPTIFIFKKTKQVSIENYREILQK